MVYNGTMIVVSLFSFIALQLYTALMIILRGALFRTKIYYPMLWNLFLSLSPLLIQLAIFIMLLVMGNYIGQLENFSKELAILFKATLIAGLLVWALFFPNATYLITELNFNHRKKNDPVPEYYDIVMVFTLAATGVINALVSLTVFHLIVVGFIIPAETPDVVPTASWVVVCCYALLSSFAIYLGREVRFNSWDLLHPMLFLEKLWRHVSQKANAQHALGYTIFFSGILIIGHLIFFPLVYSLLV